MKVTAKEAWRAGYPLVLIFVLLVTGIVTVGGLYYRHYERQFRTEAERQLITIAELKVNELVQYRKERLEDATVFFNNAAFSMLVRRFFEHPEDADAERQIQEWVGKFVTTDQYDLVYLLDTQGVTRLSSPAGRPPISPVVAERIPEVLRSCKIVFEDFHRNKYDQRIYLGVLVPIFNEQDTSRPLGILYLRIDPEKYLYPFIKHWPVPSETAETLLVRRDGNDALFLNELKFQTNTALNLRFPFENTIRPAVKAVLGQKGVVEGIDYRGEPVLAVLQAIPDSPWFLVARMDIAEVFKPMKERLWQVAAIIFILLFGSGAFVGLIWRHQRARFYREKYEAEEARAKLSAIVESSEDAILTKSLNGIITSWNLGAEHIYGYTAAEVIGKPIMIIIPPKYSNEFPLFTEKIKRGEAIKHYETERIRKNGERIQMSLTLSPVKDKVGTIVGISVIGRDITERKRAEELLHREQTLTTTLMDNLPDAVYFKDTASRFLRVNRSHSRKFNVDEPAQLIGKSDGDFFSDEHARQALADEQEIIRTGRPLLNVEEKETWPNGTVTWALTTKLPLRDTAGQVIGTCGISRDITERKQMEEKLRQLSRAVEQSPASIVITNPAGDIEYVNPKFVELTGYTLAEALGKNPRILKSGEKGTEAYRELWQTITAGKVWRGEFHNKKKNGELYWESASISPIRDSADRITHYVAVKEDITAQKQTEAERDKLIQDLRDALANVRSLSGLLPICANCKKIRDDKGYWSQVESYIQQHSEAKFSHGLCPDCVKKLYPNLAEGTADKSPKKTA